ncbi:signal transduction histidine kinase [Rhizomicrobium palustre]|uniref:histidine kinase n=1 Tax=Rhizomicrobium palustre TaxID=189966 RepID=A0A846MVN7_9PROT|nr:sensor histidine kinase [Rhizomicrobium palustre]NIK87618.1 signal transduction histidine kinase [Rhizomicrobium palustre]
MFTKVPRSLASRLILAAAVWAAIALAAGGYVLSNAFMEAMRDNFDTQLQVDLDGLITAADGDSFGGIVLRDRFLNRRFARAYSGLYWQIDPSDSMPVMFSHSLLDQTLRPDGLKVKDGSVSFGYAQGPLDQHLRVIARRVSFPVTNTPNPKDFKSYTFLVAGDVSSVEASVAEFNHIIFWSFAALFFGLLAAVLLQVRIGLQPLRRVEESLSRIRSGAAQHLEGKFPAEIAPLASELNSLIEHSAEVVGRARTHVANLAHFLKTPLSVLVAESEANPGPLADTVKRQVGVMRRQVDHYLTRARAAGAVNALGNRTQVSPVLEDLARVLMRIHQERGIIITVHCPETLYFRGERQDLEEMAGNLMDNACKWAKGRVIVTAERLEGRLFQLSIEDDGPGLAPEDRGRVMSRGERLDESVPGTGLGLSIVREIAKLYGGQLVMDEARLGGLATRLNLPVLG